MQKLTITTTVVGILAVGSVVLASMAAAAPTGGSNAADTVKTLRDMGYSVQLNGSLTGSLSDCTVTGVHGLPNTDAADQFGTVYVDISCPSLND
jgi:hypothetical protein